MKLTRVQKLGRFLVFVMLFTIEHGTLQPERQCERLRRRPQAWNSKQGLFGEN